MKKKVKHLLEISYLFDIVSRIDEDVNWKIV